MSTLTRDSTPITRMRCVWWFATGRRNWVTSGQSVGTRHRLMSEVSTNLCRAKRREGRAAMVPGAASFSLDVASWASDAKHWVESAVRKWETATSSRRAEPEKRLFMAAERMASSFEVASGPPVAVASSTARKPPAAVVLEEAMMRSSCMHAWACMREHARAVMHMWPCMRGVWACMHTACVGMHACLHVCVCVCVCVCVPARAY